MKCATAQIAESSFRFDLVALAVAAAKRVKGFVQSPRLEFLYDTLVLALGSLQSIARVHTITLVGAYA
jgi:hypothetical protein